MHVRPRQVLQAGGVRNRQRPARVDPAAGRSDLPRRLPGAEGLRGDPLRLDVRRGVRLGPGQAVPDGRAAPHGAGHPQRAGRARQSRHGRGPALDRRLRRGRAAGDARRGDGRCRPRGRADEAGPARLRRRHQRLHRRGALRSGQDAGRVPGAREADRGLEADGHGGDRVAHRRHLRKGRRRGGAGLARLPGDPQALRPPWRRARLPGLPRLRQPRGAHDRAQALPLLRPGQAEAEGARADRPGVVPGGEPDRVGRGAERERGRAAVHPAPRGLERPPGRPARVEVGHADRRDGTAGRLLLAADPHGDGDPRSRRAARPRRDLPGDQPLRAARPRPGLRLERDHGEHRRRGPVRGEAVRAGRVGADDRVAALPLQGRSAFRSRSRSGSSRPRRRSRT